MSGLLFTWQSDKERSEGDDPRAGRRDSHWSVESAVKCSEREEREGREDTRREGGRAARPTILRLRHSRELVGTSLRMAAHC